MSYFKAKECFKDNVPRIDPSTEPIMFNINNGLSNLTEAIEQDMMHIKNLLVQILNNSK